MMLEIPVFFSFSYKTNSIKITYTLMTKVDLESFFNLTNRWYALGFTTSDQFTIVSVSKDGAISEWNSLVLSL